MKQNLYIEGEHFTAIYVIAEEGLSVYVCGNSINSQVIELFKAITFSENKVKAYCTYANRSLSTINIEVAKHCNLHCKHCYAAVDCSDVELMPRNSYNNIFEQISRLKYPVNLRITGGEPTLHPDIVDICKLAINGVISKTTHTLLTNGTFGPYLLRPLLDTGINVQISLYGTNYDDFYSFTSGNRRLFDNLMININSIPESSKGQIILAIYNTSDREKLNRCVEFALERGIKYDISGINVVGRAIESKDIIVQSRVKYRKLILNNQLCETNRICINTQGYVTPCPFLCRNKKYWMGNLHDNDLLDILNGPNFREYDSYTIDDIPGCCNCPLKYICSGGCGAETENATGSRLRMFPRCELEEQFSKLDKDRIYKVEMYSPGNFDFNEINK